MSDKKNNIFFWGPGGYGPYIHGVGIEADHIECGDDDDDWSDAADEYYDENLRDSDYGVFYFDRKNAEELYKQLGKLLDK
jgi:hypothetical protein